METTIVTFDEKGNAQEKTFKFRKLPEWGMAKTIGYEPKTTFWQDFSIADLYGLNAIHDTFRRAFREWQDNVVYVAELALVLNHKGCFYYAASEQHDNNERLYALSQTYFAMFQAVHDYAHDHFTGDDADYYFNVTD